MRPDLDRSVDETLARAMRNTRYFAAPGDLSKVVGVVVKGELEEVAICSFHSFVEAFGDEFGREMLDAIDEARPSRDGRLPIVVVADGFAQVAWIPLRRVAPLSLGGTS